MSNVKSITHNGETRTIEEWAKIAGIPHKTFRIRVRHLGWSMDRALSTPLVIRGNRGGGRPKAGVPRQCPAYKRHPRGHAYARWKMHGKPHEKHFGQYGSAEAGIRYRRFAAEWAAGVYDATGLRSPELLVSELADQWLNHCHATYRKDGRITTEVGHAKAAAEVMKDIYGDVPAASFTPAAMRACRQVWIGQGKARHTINSYTARIVRCFGWGVANSLVPVEVHSTLKLVETLAPGRTAAPDREPKTPATDEQIEATIPKLAPRDPETAATLATMIRLQRLTGMRPGEVCALTPADLNRAGEVWLYTVGKANKNRHRGKRQVYYLGPKAVALLTPLLAGKGIADRLFPIARNTYGVAVHSASVRAGCGAWTPHQLRHAMATEVARRFCSLEHAAAAIGDSAAVTAAFYLHADPRERAKIEVAKAMG